MNISMSKYTESIDMIKVSWNNYTMNNTNKCLGAQVLISRNWKLTNLFELSWLIVSIAKDYLVVRMKMITSWQ